MASDQSLNHAYDTTGKTIVPIRADLAVTDPEFINLRAMCASEEVVCAAVSCENRKLEVRAKGSRRNADGSISQVRARAASAPTPRSRWRSTSRACAECSTCSNSVRSRQSVTTAVG